LTSKNHNLQKTRKPGDVPGFLLCVPGMARSAKDGAVNAEAKAIGGSD
jgi:hypothetical protein